jgi:hypothetical protein
VLVPAGHRQPRLNGIDQVKSGVPADHRQLGYT